MIFFILNSLLALMGIFISWRIFSMKKSSEKTVCYIGGDCNNVLTSKFSKFFGISIEKIGFIYYSFLFLGFLYLSIFNPVTQLILWLFIGASIGLAFSLYLTLIQGMYLKEWCPWCLSSAITTTLIFIFTYTIFSEHAGAITLYLAETISVLNLFHLVGIAIGVSGATIGGLLVINFLKDFKIDSNEDRKLTILDQIIWLSIVILVVVNLCYYVIDPQTYFSLSQLLAQLIILIVLIVNNALLSLWVNPKLIGIRIDMKSINVFRIFWLRQWALAMGVVSIISWYAILFISFFIKIDNGDISNVIGYYLAIVIMSVIISQLIILLVDKIKITSDNTYKFK
jgi:uncharacterized membrane protein